MPGSPILIEDVKTLTSFATGLANIGKKASARCSPFLSIFVEKWVEQLDSTIVVSHIRCSGTANSGSLGNLAAAALGTAEP